MPDTIWLNGRLVPPDQALISINDRGFLFGDSVYEVIRSYAGRLWALERHLRRLQRSLAALDITSVDPDQVRAAIHQTYAASALPDAALYLQITRGVAPRSHVYPPGLRPTIVITVRDIAPLLRGIDPEGVPAITAPDLRWRRCDIKSTNLLPNVLAKTQAHHQGADEAILVDGEGFITEGASTSVFWVVGGTLFTTPAGPPVLPSITREFVEEIAGDEGLPLVFERVARARFQGADEIFLAGTGHDVCPVIALDGRPVADGRPGPITRRLQQVFAARVAAGDDAPR